MPVSFITATKKNSLQYIVTWTHKTIPILCLHCRESFHYEGMPNVIWTAHIRNCQKPSQSRPNTGMSQNTDYQS